MAAKRLTIPEMIRSLEGSLQRFPIARQEALEAAAVVVRDEAKSLIGTEYAGWPALADATVEDKQRLGYVDQVSATDPLLRTGELRASIQIREATPERAVVASDDPIAGYQEFGTDRIPPRPFIGAAVFRKKDAIKVAIAEPLIHNLRGSRNV